MSIGLLGVSALSGCVPWRTTEQPLLSLTVQGASGLPVQDAAVQFKKVKVALLPKTETLTLVTNTDGKAMLEGKSDWYMAILAPDGGYSYEWYMCIQKDGYRPFVVNQLLHERYQGEKVIALAKSQVSERCTWSEHYPFGFRNEPQPSVPPDVPASAAPPLQPGRG